VLAPRDRTAALVGLLDRDVHHEPVRRGAVPVVLSGLEEDAIAGADDLDRATFALTETDTLGDEDRLAVRMRVTPSVTKIVWPCGWVCHAVRAPGVKWTAAAANVEVPAGAATASM
jgi:hypothetical protein